MSNPIDPIGPMGGIDISCEVTSPLFPNREGELQLVPVADRHDGPLGAALAVAGDVELRVHARPAAAAGLRRGAVPVAPRQAAPILAVRAGRALESGLLAALVQHRQQRGDAHQRAPAADRRGFIAEASRDFSPGGRNDGKT